MPSLLLLLGAYLLGGITLIPLIFALICLHGYLTLPARNYSLRNDRNENVQRHTTPSESIHAETSSPLVSGIPRPTGSAPDVAAGYLAVCREYVPGGINGKPPERITPAGDVVPVESPSVYQTMYRSIFERNKASEPSIGGGLAKSMKGRNVFYVVLRHGYLMLYDNSEQLEVRHVISLAHYDVDIYAGGETIPEGELWIKRNCIRLMQRSKEEAAVSGAKPYYLFSDNCSKKEDFYHAILRSQAHGSNIRPARPSPLTFDGEDLIHLIQQLHASEDNLHTRWANALIGRLFLALYKSDRAESYIREKIAKKMSRVAKPTFIRSTNVRNIDLGKLPPFITNPRLKALTLDGDLTVEADITYKGNFRLELSAVARIELGNHFKPREVTIVLASILKRLEGHILVRIKPPPSNRFWFAFETAPRMDLSLEPIVSTRQITYGVILRAIENRIREVISETLVLPNWDDIPFSDTVSQGIRGGIWETHTGDTEDIPQGAYGIEHEGLGSNKSRSLPNEGLTTYMNGSAAKVISTNTPTPKKMRVPGCTTAARSCWNSTDEWAAVSSGVDLGAATESSAKRTRSPLDDPSAERFVDLVDNPQKALSARNDHNKDTSATFENAAFIPQGEILLDEPAGIFIKQDAVPGVASGASGTSSGVYPQHLAADSDVVGDHSNQAKEGGYSGAADTLPGADLSSSEPLRVNRKPASEKQATFNQSFNSATAIARKWLASRQKSDDASLARQEADSMQKSISDSRCQSSPRSDAPTRNVNIPDTLAEQSETDVYPRPEPMGRGRPFPRSGMPLPQPGKRSTWSLPAGSSFANFARRKSLHEPQTFVSNLERSQEDRSSPIASKDARDNNSIGVNVEVGQQHSEHYRAPRLSSATTNTPLGTSWPLPRGRSHLSNAESSLRTTGNPLLVVDASSEGSVPPSLVQANHHEDQGSIVRGDSNRSVPTSHAVGSVGQPVKPEEGETQLQMDDRPTSKED